MPCVWDFTVPGVSTLQKGVEMAIVTPQVLPSVCMAWMPPILPNMLCTTFPYKSGRHIDAYTILWKVCLAISPVNWF